MREKKRSGNSGSEEIKNAFRERTNGTIRIASERRKTL